MMDKTLSLSPSFIKYTLRRCSRCAWLKLRHDISPIASPFPSVFAAIHRIALDYLSECEDVLGGRLVEKEKWVKGPPVLDAGSLLRAEIRGRVDGIVALPNGGYAVIDIKTTERTGTIVEDYGLQLNLYRHCLVDSGGHPYQDIRKLTLLAFNPKAFRVDDGAASLDGAWESFDVPIVIDAHLPIATEAFGLVNAIIPPPPSDDCRFCKYHAKVKEVI